MREGSIKRICSIGDVQFRITLISKKIRQVIFEISICCPQSFMRIMPAFSFNLYRAFFQKGLPCFMPHLQSLIKILFIVLTKRHDKTTQFFACLEPWPSGQITICNCFLVKVAHLHRNICKQVSDARPTIDNNGLYSESPTL